MIFYVFKAHNNLTIKYTRFNLSNIDSKEVR